MRTIKKGAEPAALRQWKKANKAAPQNLAYGNLPQAERASVAEALLREQGWLCAYTLMRLDTVDACHIEHVEPQGMAPGKDLDYANMAACFPRNGGDVTHGYGAPVKGGGAIKLNVDFVSPHTKGCEARFLFDAQGGVRAPLNDVAARKTIERLRLCHPSLEELRKQAMKAYGLTLDTRGLRKPPKRLTAAQARQLASQLQKPEPQTLRLEPFCVALAQVATAYARRETERSRRLRGK